MNGSAGHARGRAIHKKVIDGIQTAQEKLPPHHVWLKRMVGMAGLRGTVMRTPRTRREMFR